MENSFGDLHMRRRKARGCKHSLRVSDIRILKPFIVHSLCLKLQQVKLPSEAPGIDTRTWVSNEEAPPWQKRVTKSTFDEITCFTVIGIPTPIAKLQEGECNRFMFCEGTPRPISFTGAATAGQ
jgi:hypothetical protein